MIRSESLSSPVWIPALLGFTHSLQTGVLQAFKARLDVAVGSLGCWLATLHIAGGWNWMVIVVLFNPGHSMISEKFRTEKHKLSTMKEISQP